MDVIIYREGNEEDIPQILVVIQAAFAEYVGRLDPPSSAGRKTVEVVKEELRGQRPLSPNTIKSSSAASFIGLRLIACIWIG